MSSLALVRQEKENKFYATLRVTLKQQKIIKLLDFVEDIDR
jgi:hypothetical protein